MDDGAGHRRSNQVAAGSSRPPTTDGWPGFHGTAWYNDPAEDMTAIFVMQRAHAGDQTLPMWLVLWTDVYQAIDD
jgi:CubicO group peptidase (beta-lactamase class C family)